MAEARRATRLLPSYQEESLLLAQGYTLVAGLDEVGRGPLAGPLLAGVAVLPPRPTGRWVELVRDSKQLTPAQRERVLPHIQDVALGLAVGMCSAQEVDSLGVSAATRLAMRRALEALPVKPEFLLLDAFPLPEVPLPQKAIIDGDALCLSIAAASIVAKVTRDRMMEKEDAVYPCYGFARHKGYGTREHLLNLRRYGPCPIHRLSFAPVRQWQALDEHSAPAAGQA